MSGYTLAQAGARAVEAGQVGFKLSWAQLKRHKKSLLISYGVIFVLISVLCLAQTLSGVSANVVQAEGLAAPQVVAEYTQLALRFVIGVLALRLALAVLFPLIFTFLSLLMLLPLFAIDACGLYLASRLKGYREHLDLVLRFLGNKQSGFVLAMVWCFFLTWFEPELMLWPGKALGLGQTASLMLTLYAGGLLASLILWLSLRRALEQEEDAATRKRVAGWLGNPSGVKDFIDIPLGTMAMIVMGGYLLLPGAEWGVNAAHRMVAGYFVAYQDYERIVGNFPRERLLARLDTRGLDSLASWVLPTPERLETALRMELPDFRSWRDRSMVHLIPLVLILTLVMLWIRRDLYQRALKRSGP